MKIFKYILTFVILVPMSSIASNSICYGSTAKGRLEYGVELPAAGNNFVTYSNIVRLAGRTYVHAKVRDIIVNAYKDLEAEQPDKIFKYAETGFENGGQFKPHKTHRNGLSVDFITPVINESGESVHLPTHPLNKFGYDIEFNDKDKFEDYTIDYTALAAHIVALHKAAVAQGVDIWRVIFDPKLQPKLFKTKYGDCLRKYVQLSKKPSWVRHDEHYHVDFKIPCKELTK